jgi:nitrogen fixation NifU-like protein
MAAIEDLYQDIILEHNKRPRNFGPLKGSTHHAEGLNPLCGDQLQVALFLDGKRITGLHFEGQGCAISKASASMMTEAIKGLEVREARTVASKVIKAFLPGGEDLVLEEDGEIAALLGVRQFPARIKCATLAWHALICALDGGTSVSTETGSH